MLVVRRWFCSIKKKIEDATYEELTTLIADKYKHKEYRNSISASLFEIDQKFQIFKPGNCVLDVGAGPSYLWTDLALKLTENDQNSHLVISNDISETNRAKSNNVFVHGDFILQNVQANISLALENRKIDTILLDVSPNFSGNVNNDGFQITNVAAHALQFGRLFLKEGGSAVFKMLECDSSNSFQAACRVMFHEMSIFRPTILRKDSPVCFFVLKGFMIGRQYQELETFLKRYRGGTVRKRQIVKEYQGKYSWDPVEEVRRRARCRVLQMWEQGKSEKEILRIYQKDPYVQIEKLVAKLRNVIKASQNQKIIDIKKALYEYSEKTVFTEIAELPVTEEEYIEMLETMLAARYPKNTVSVQEKQSALLGENQIFMKTQLANATKLQKRYLKSDLQGNYEDNTPYENYALQLSKLQRAFPQAKDKLEQLKMALKNNEPVSMKDLFNFDTVNPNGLKRNRRAVEKEAYEKSVQEKDEQEAAKIGERYTRKYDQKLERQKDEQSHRSRR